ncbi:MAG: putative capsular polysaccharide synthesis family protein [Acidimicrobiales bacterium]
MKEPARVARRRYSVVDRLSTWAEMEMLLRREDPVLVYSMGKAGTSALTHALEAATPRPVLKAHTLNQRELRRRISAANSSVSGHRPRFWWRSQWLSLHMRASRRRRWQIITAVREPVARAVSAYFYGLQSQFERGAIDHISSSAEDHRDDICTMIRRLGVEQDWFRTELEATTGIDVYAHPFDPTQGSQLIPGDRHSLLLLRFEDFDRAGPSAIGNFLRETTEISLVPVNVNRTKNAGPYASFLKNANLPLPLLSAVYSSELCEHFYTREERTQFIERWTA